MMEIEFNGKQFEVAKIKNNSGLKRAIVELVLNAPSPDRECELTDFLMCLQAIINKYCKGDDFTKALWGEDE